MRKRRAFRIISALLLTFWMGCIFFFSSQPAKESNNLSGGVIEQVVSAVYPGFSDMEKAEQTELVSSFQHVTRKTAHFSAYGLLGILSFLSLISYRKPKFSVRCLISAGVCLLYAISDEIHQLFVPGRSGEVRDVLLDFSGALTGILFCMAITAFVKRRRAKKAAA